MQDKEEGKERIKGRRENTKIMKTAKRNMLRTEKIKGGAEKRDAANQITNFQGTVNACCLMI